jgi:putative DNA primase/helicase
MAAAETIAAALGGRKAGGGWIVRCPAHDDRTPSLSIRDAGDGKVLVRCHAGCAQEQVISILRSRGLWTTDGPSSRSKQKPIVQHCPSSDHLRETAA